MQRSVVYTLRGCTLILIAIFFISGCGRGTPTALTPIEPESSDDSDGVFNTNTTEQESREIAEQYVQDFEEYKKQNGRDLKFISAKRTFCDSCFKVVYSFVIDSQKPDFKTDTIVMELNVQGGAVVNYATSSVGLEPRPASELCNRTFLCEDGREYPIERYDEKSAECYRVIFLKNPCIVPDARMVTINTPELKTCMENIHHRLDVTSLGEYICVFPDESFCAVSAYHDGACTPNECFRECKRGPKGEGIYSTCTGNLLIMTSCGE